MFSKEFRRNVYVTRGFLAVRCALAFVIILCYLLIAAGVQSVFVGWMGSSVFNYIAGGLLALFVGYLFCYYVGSILFMFVKGWHVAAIAYVPKLEKSDASALDVGIRAFKRKFVTFGVVYGVRIVLKEIVSNLKDTVWNYLENVPYVSILKRFSTNPIVEHLASDVLQYGFDAVVFYCVRYPGGDDVNVSDRVVEALKKYMLCLPGILMSSIQTFLMFKVVPKVVGVIIFFIVVSYTGITAGLFSLVLMYPLGFFLDNTIFDALTMITFLSVFSEKCSEEVDGSNPLVEEVSNILSGKSSMDKNPKSSTHGASQSSGDKERIATTAKDFLKAYGQNSEAGQETDAGVVEDVSANEIPSDVLEADLEEAMSEMQRQAVVAADEPEAGPSTATESRSSPLSKSAMASLARAIDKVSSDEVIARKPEPEPENLDLADDDIIATCLDELTQSVEVGEAVEDQQPPVSNPFAGGTFGSIFRNTSAADLEASIGGSPFVDAPNQGTDRAQSILFGGDDD